MQQSLNYLVLKTLVMYCHYVFKEYFFLWLIDARSMLNDNSYQHNKNITKHFVEITAAQYGNDRYSSNLKALCAKYLPVTSGQRKFKETEVLQPNTSSVHVSWKHSGTLLTSICIHFVHVFC